MGFRVHGEGAVPTKWDFTFTVRLPYQRNGISRSRRGCRTRETGFRVHGEGAIPTKSNFAFTATLSISQTIVLSINYNLAHLFQNNSLVISQSLRKDYFFLGKQF